MSDNKPQPSGVSGLPSSPGADLKKPPHRSLPLVGSNAQDDGDRGSLHELTAPEGWEPEANSEPSPRGLRRIASCPQNVLSRANEKTASSSEIPAIDWRLIAVDTSLDDATITGSPNPIPDIDPSMLLMRTLSHGVFDADGLQRQKEEERIALRAQSESPEQLGANASVVACARCGADDTPMWRPGPDGPGTLCNVCGLLYAQSERRKLADGKARRA